MKGLTHTELRKEIFLIERFLIRHRKQVNEYEQVLRRLKTKLAKPERVLRLVNGVN